MTIEKNKIVLDFDSDSLKELKKILFKRGLSPQKFFAYIVELVSIRDPRMDPYIEEAAKGRHTGKSRKNAADAESLYSLIEQNLDKHRNGV